MMRRWKIWVAIFVALLMSLGIFYATPIIGPETSSQVTALENPDFWLWAGQWYFAGNGEVTNDVDSLDFTIDPDDCAIYEIHVNIFDSTPLEGGQNSPGQFPYTFDYTSNPKTGQFDFSIPFTPNAHPSTIYIALHAKVVCGNYEGQTAWAGGADDPEDCDRFPGDPWAYYFQYTVQ